MTENAHLRLGLLEYQRFTEKISTRIRVRVDRYMGEGRKAHLLSVLGNDSDIGAVTAAVQDKASFTLTFPDGSVKDVSLGEHASCYKGSLTLPDRKQPVRHLLAVSQELHTKRQRRQDHPDAVLPGRGLVYLGKLSWYSRRPGVGRACAQYT